MITNGTTLVYYAPYPLYYRVLRVFADGRIKFDYPSGVGTASCWGGPWIWTRERFEEDSRPDGTGWQIACEQE